MSRGWNALILVLLTGLCTACGDEPPPRPPSEITVLLEQLAGFDEEAASTALTALVEVGPPAAAPLGALLSHAEIPVRRAAARTLRELGYRAAAAAPALAAALSDPDREVRRDASRALRELGSAAAPALPTIRKRHEEARSALEEEQRRIVARGGGARDIAVVRTFARLDDVARRAGNATALLPTNDVVIDGHPVSHWVNRWMVRQQGREESAQRLSRLAAAQVVPHLLPWSRMAVQLRRTGASVWGAPPRLAAQRVLYAPFGEEVTPLFARALGAGDGRCDPDTRGAVLQLWQALDVGPGAFGSSLMAHRESKSPLEKWAATRILLHRAAPIHERITLLRELLASPEWQDHVTAARAIPHLGPPAKRFTAGLRALQAHWKGEGAELSRIVTSLAYALMRIEQGDAAADSALASTDPDLRDEAEIVLHALPERVVVPATTLQHVLLTSMLRNMRSWALVRLLEGGADGRAQLWELSKTEAGRDVFLRTLASVALHMIDANGDRSLPPSAYAEFLPILKPTASDAPDTALSALRIVRALGEDAIVIRPELEAFLRSVSKAAAQRPDGTTGWLSEPTHSQGRVVAEALHTHVVLTQDRTLAASSLQHPHPAVRAGAVRALGLLEAPSIDDLKTVISRLRRLEAVKTEGATERYTRDDMRGALTTALEGMLVRRPSFAPQVAALLDAPASDTRQAGLGALRALETPPVPYLTRALALVASADKSESEEAQNLAYDIFKAQRRAVLPVLLQYVSAEHPEVRGTVIGGFRVLGWSAGNALPKLRELAATGPDHQRATAALAIEVIRARDERSRR